MERRDGGDGFGLVDHSRYLEAQRIGHARGAQSAWFDEDIPEQELTLEVSLVEHIVDAYIEQVLAVLEEHRAAGQRVGRQLHVADIAGLHRCNPACAERE